MLPLAVVLPGDDRPARAVGDELGNVLTPRRRADGDAVRRPQNGARGVHPLGVDVVAAPAAVVVPRDDRPARAVGDDFGILLIPRRRADGDAVRRPLNGARGAHPLGIDVVAVPAAVVVPRDYRPAGAVRSEVGSQLRPVRGANGNTVRNPLPVAILTAFQGDIVQCKIVTVVRGVRVEDLYGRRIGAPRVEIYHEILPDSRRGRRLNGAMQRLVYIYVQYRRLCGHARRNPQAECVQGILLYRNGPGPDRRAERQRSVNGHHEAMAARVIAIRKCASICRPRVSQDIVGFRRGDIAGREYICTGKSGIAQLKVAVRDKLLGSERHSQRNETKHQRCKCRMPFSREIAYHRACPSDTLHLEAASIRIGCKLYHYSHYVAAIILLQVPGRGHARRAKYPGSPPFSREI